MDNCVFYNNLSLNLSHFSKTGYKKTATIGLLENEKWRQ